MALGHCHRCDLSGNTKMNVLYVAQYFSFNPTHASAVTTYEIVSRLAEKGYNITVVVPNAYYEESENLQVKELSRIHVCALTHFSSAKVRDNTFLRFLTISLWYVFLVFSLLRNAREKKYNIVMAMYHPNHLATASAYLVSRILKLPIIVKEHDLIPEFEDPKTLRRLHTKFTMVLNRLVLKHSDLVLVLSNDRKELARKFYGIEEKKLIVFPNGVDPVIFKQNTNRNSLSRMLGPRLEGCKILLHVGLLTENRGLENLVTAMPEVIEKQPKTKLVIVGEGPERERIMDFASRLRVNDNIIFIGKVKHHSVPNFTSVADITIGPLKSSIPNSTSFPIKVLEYMACSKPTVASYGGVSSDLIIDGYNGTLVHEGDAKELASAILKLLSDETFSNELGCNARRHIEKYHDWDNLILMLDETIKAKVARSRSGV